MLVEKAGAGGAPDHLCAGVPPLPPNGPPPPQPLHIAASEGHVEAVQVLIAGGAAVNAVTQSTPVGRVPPGQTPLHRAALAAAGKKRGAGTVLRVLAMAGGCCCLACVFVGSPMGWWSWPQGAAHPHPLAALPPCAHEAQASTWGLPTAPATPLMTSFACTSHRPPAV
jgi:hypothetical protein